MTKTYKQLMEEAHQTIPEVTVDEVKNRSTISGAVDIGRLPGFVQLSLLVPRDRLERLGVVHLAETQYGTAAGW